MERLDLFSRFIYVFTARFDRCRSHKKEEEQYMRRGRGGRPVDRLDSQPSNDDNADISCCPLRANLLTSIQRTDRADGGKWKGSCSTEG